VTEWQCRRLESVAEKVVVGYVGPSSEHFIDDGVPFLRTGNVGIREVIRSNLKQVTPEFHQKQQKSVLKHGDVLVSRVVSDEVNAAVVPAEFDGANCGNIIVIRPGKLLDPRFVVHLISAPRSQRQLLNRQVGSAQGVVNTTVLKEWEVPVPPLAEQRRIAAILDKAEALRAKRRDTIAQIVEFESALFCEYFGDPAVNDRRWPRKPLGELLVSIDSGWSPVCLDRPAEDDEWGVLKLGAVTTCEYDDSQQKALPTTTEPRPELEVRPNDILFTRKNTYDLVAACALVGQTRPKLMLSDLVFRLKLKADAPIAPSYLQRLLTAPSKRREIQKMAGGSAGSMPNISKAKLSTALIEIPPVALQRAFAHRISIARQLRNQQRDGLVGLDQLFASLQHRAFRGEL
jgi:type I restriction enzyme S subunit